MSSLGKCSHIYSVAYSRWPASILHCLPGSPQPHIQSAPTLVGSAFWVTLESVCLPAPGSRSLLQPPSHFLPPVLPHRSPSFTPNQNDLATVSSEPIISTFTASHSLQGEAYPPQQVSPGPPHVGPHSSPSACHSCSFLSDILGLLIQRGTLNGSQFFSLLLGFHICCCLFPALLLF